MTQRRELDNRLALYGDLSGILSAMRSFALAELRRVTQREDAQQRSAQSLSEAFDAMSPALPPAGAPAGDIWLLLGSVRGFCASFNEDVANRWRQEKPRPLATIVAGERLAALMPEEASAVAGAVSATDAVPAIERILGAVDGTRQAVGSDAGLVVCLRDEDGARVERLQPFSVASGRTPDELPVTHEPAAQVAAGVAQHFLFHRLLALLLRSLRVENHMRLLQMENALQHIERNTDALKLLRNRLRQDEIVEEIELIQRDASRF